MVAYLLLPYFLVHLPRIWRTFKTEQCSETIRCEVNGTDKKQRVVYRFEHAAVREFANSHSVIRRNVGFQLQPYTQGVGLRFLAKDINTRLVQIVFGSNLSRFQNHSTTYCQVLELYHYHLKFRLYQGSITLDVRRYSLVFFLQIRVIGLAFLDDTHILL